MSSPIPSSVPFKPAPTLTQLTSQLEQVLKFSNPAPESSLRTLVDTIKSISANYGSAVAHVLANLPGFGFDTMSVLGMRPDGSSDLLGYTVQTPESRVSDILDNYGIESEGSSGMDYTPGQWAVEAMVEYTRAYWAQAFIGGLSLRSGPLEESYTMPSGAGLPHIQFDRPEAEHDLVAEVEEELKALPEAEQKVFGEALTVLRTALATYGKVYRQTLSTSASELEFPVQNAIVELDGNRHSVLTPVPPHMFIPHLVERFELDVAEGATADDSSELAALEAAANYTTAFCTHMMFQDAIVLLNIADTAPGVFRSGTVETAIAATGQPTGTRSELEDPPEHHIRAVKQNPISD